MIRIHYKLMKIKDLNLPDFTKKCMSGASLVALPGIHFFVKTGKFETTYVYEVVTDSYESSHINKFRNDN